MKETKISLIICTRNRASSFEKSLKSIDANEMLDVSGELIVVNNGSIDNTTGIIEKFRRNSVFPIKTVYEHKRGLSNARNAGIMKAAGRIIAFTDDDCHLQSGYLREAVTAFDSGQFSYCGGRILLYDKTDANYGCNYQEKFELIPPYSFIPTGKIQGANMVIDRKLIDKIGLFDPMFGAGTPFRCEDIDYCVKASMAGYWGAHVPSIVVYHHHGRKPGADIEKLKLDNDYARGAYYAKYILRGKYKYIKGWLTTTKNSEGMHNLRRELKGAVDYMSALIKENLF